MPPRRSEARGSVLPFVLMALLAALTMYGFFIFLEIYTSIQTPL
ncbi:MAG: hypothetical protein ABEJ61_06945 [Haloferacaceae archaeon]